MVKNSARRVVLLAVFGLATTLASCGGGPDLGVEASKPFGDRAKIEAVLQSKGLQMESKELEFGPQLETNRSGRKGTRISWRARNEEAVELWLEGGELVGLTGSYRSDSEELRGRLSKVGAFLVEYWSQIAPGTAKTFRVAPASVPVEGKGAFLASFSVGSQHGRWVKQAFVMGGHDKIIDRVRIWKQ